MSRNKLECNRFKTIYEDVSDTEHCRNNTSEFPLVYTVYIKKSRLTGWSDSLTEVEKVALFKAWLASNPLIVRYELAEQVETPLSVIPLLDTYEGTTNIFTTANPQVNIAAEFVPSTTNITLNKNEIPIRGGISE